MASLDDVLLFARVVELGSFTLAAEELETSRSLVSKRIAALEERLGVRLLNRTTRKLSLTESGEVYYGYCSAIRDTLDEAEQRVGALGERPRGVLKLNVPVTFGELFIAPLLADFLADHPEVSVDMHMDDRFLDPVEGGFDLTIRIGTLADSSLVASRIATMWLVVCGAPAYLARHGTPEHPDQLRAHNCLTYRYARERSDEWQLFGPDGPRTVRVSGNLRASNGLALRNAARAGLGLVLSPEFMVRDDLAGGRLVQVLADWCRERIGVYALYPHAHRLPAKTRAFVDFLRTRFAGWPGWAGGG